MCDASHMHRARIPFLAIGGINGLAGLVAVLSSWAYLGRAPGMAEVWMAIVGLVVGSFTVGTAGLAGWFSVSAPEDPWLRYALKLAASMVLGALPWSLLPMFL